MRPGVHSQIFVYRPEDLSLKVYHNPGQSGSVTWIGVGSSALVLSPECSDRLFELLKHARETQETP